MTSPGAAGTQYKVEEMDEDMKRDIVDKVQDALGVVMNDDKV